MNRFNKKIITGYKIVNSTISFIVFLRLSLNVKSPILRTVPKIVITNPIRYPDIIKAVSANIALIYTSFNFFFWSHMFALII